MATTAPTRLQQPPPASDSIGPLRRHVGLCVELAITNFKLKYTGSVLGYVWSFLKPLFLFGTTYFVFIYIFHVDGGVNAGSEFGAQLLLGIVVWTFFAEATGAAVASIASQGALIRKAAFPRVVLVIAATLTALLTFVINLTLVVSVAAILGHMHVGWRSLLAPLFIVELYVLILGVSLLLASMFVFYRDVGHLWEIFSQLLFYGSAVVFPVSLLTGRVLPRLIGINPVAQVIADIRHAIVIDDPRVPWMANYDGLVYVVPLAVVVALAFIGYRTFQHLTPRFAEAL
jgi:ABC-2 type transport system permease protein